MELQYFYLVYLIDAPQTRHRLCVGHPSPRRRLPGAPRAPRGQWRKHVHKLPDELSPTLLHALGDPHEVTNFLLLELEVGVEASEVHLAVKGELQSLHFLRVEGIVDAVPSESLVGVHLPHGAVECVLHEHLAKAALVAGGRKLLRRLGVEVAEPGVERRALRGARAGVIQPRVKGVERHVDGVAVGTDLEHVAHDLGGLAPDGLREAVEVLKVELHDGVAKDLELHLVEDGAHLAGVGDGLLPPLEPEAEVLAHRRVHKHRLVQVRVPLGRALEGRDRAHGALAEETERVALLDELLRGAAGERALEQVHHIVHHVLHLDVVEEGEERLRGLRLEVLELLHELDHGAVPDDGRRQLRIVVQEPHVVRVRLEVHLDVVQRLRLLQPRVVVVVQEAAAEALHQRLHEAVVRVERRHAPVRHGCQCVWAAEPPGSAALPLRVCLHAATSVAARPRAPRKRSEESGSRWMS
mmetsp:Transcript_22910/g.71149  ORF Transcript_22910/g.71149 Transcript_22910/m.71149 type:complete len:468 (+) Transcript_22910:964-2367(+)